MTIPTPPPATDQMLMDKARRLNDEFLLIISGKQQDWLTSILFDDDGKPSPPQLTPNSRAFLQCIYNDRYTDTTGITHD